jgi:hypothetical protein
MYTPHPKRRSCDIFEIITTIIRKNQTNIGDHTQSLHFSTYSDILLERYAFYDALSDLPSKKWKNVAATPLGVLYMYHYRALTHTATKILALRASFEHFAPAPTSYTNL